MFGAGIEAGKGDRPPVVLYPIGALNAGGAQMRSLQLFREVKRRRPGVRIIVYDFSGRAGALDEAFRAAGVELIKGRHEKRETLRFWRFCRKLRPDIVHTNLGALSGYLIFVAWLTGVKVRICHFRATIDNFFGTFDRYAKRVPARFMIWLLATRVVGVSHAARAFSRVRDRQWQTLYNGIPHEPLDEELKLARARPLKGRRVMALGRIHPQKRYWRFAPIFDALRQVPGHDDATLEIVGTGNSEDMERLQGSVAASAHAGSISLSGETAEPVARLRIADVMLMTSAFEGLPGTVIEALSVGTPVVSEDLPGVREIHAYVKGVTIMKRGSTDAEWGHAIARVLAHADREEIICSFRQSPFLLDRYVTDVMRLWGIAPAAGARSGTPSFASYSASAASGVRGNASAMKTSRSLP